MSIKLISILICLLLGFSSSYNLLPDINNPIMVNPATTSLTGSAATFTIRFSFPAATANAIGPNAYASSGLSTGQFIGVAFPPSVGTADLKFDTTTTIFTATLTDSNNVKYAISQKLSVASAITTTLLAESNIIYFRLDDISANVPLKVGPGIVYTLTINWTGVKIASTSFLRSISLFTSTSNNPEKIIIDSLPVLGSVALYGDYTATTLKNLDIVNAQVVVTQGPSAASSGSTVYPYNQFDVNLTLKANTFITAADHIIVFQYPSNTVSPAGTVVTSNAAANDPLQVALKGTLALKTFSSNSFYVDGVGEDLIPNRQFVLSLKGWKALDTNVGNTANLNLVVYYKNTYSIVSYTSNSIFKVNTDQLTVSVNHPEFWDVYRGGAFPLTFTFKTTNDLSNGGWVVIQHSDAVSLTDTAGSRVSFIASTCDFSANGSSFDNSFGKRNNCFPLRTNDQAYVTGSGSTYNGSGIFFYLKAPISGGNNYYVTVWAFFDYCGGSAATTTAAMNVVYGSKDSAWTVPNFTVSIYRTIDATALNESRFTSTQTVISQSVQTAFNGVCWNNYVYASDKQGQVLNIAIADKSGRGHTLTVVDDNTKVGLINYKEEFDWISFYETNLVPTGTPWYAGVNAALLTTNTNADSRFLYTSDTTKQLAGSYFLAAFKEKNFDSGNAKYLTENIGWPYIFNTAPAQKHPPGYFVWQFPKTWFVKGGDYKGTNAACYASWAVDIEGTTTAFNPIQLLKAYKTSTTKWEYTAAIQNFFGANSIETTTDYNYIDSTRSLLPPDNTSQTGKASIVQLVSTYHDGTATPKWQLGDYTKVGNFAGDVNAAFYTNCLKWRSDAPAVTSLYTYIDIQIKWHYMGNTSASDVSPKSSTGNGTPISNIRLIKLFPETGVMNNFSNNPSTTLTSNPLVNHVVYNPTTVDSVCLLELSGSAIAGIKGTANTLVVWLFGATLLETDYNDASSTYPVAPLLSTVQAYGLQSGQVMDYENSPYTAYPQYDTAAKTLGTGQQYNQLMTQLTLSNSTADIAGTVRQQWKNNSNYLYFMGSVVYITSVTTSFLTDGTTEKNFFIPYYCPRKSSKFEINSTIPACDATSASCATSYVFPLVMASWMTMSSFNSITSANSWVNYTPTTSQPASKVLINNFDSTKSEYIRSTKKMVATSATVAGTMYNTPQTATLKWSAYTLTNQYLYVFNGTISAAGTSTYCTGHSLFLSSAISLDSTATQSFASGITNATFGQFSNSKNFYILGKAFNKALFSGLSASSNLANSNNISGLIATGTTASANYYSGIIRPTADSFLNNGQFALTDKAAYFCTSAGADDVNSLTNYVNYTGTATAGTTNLRGFILDWYSDLTSNWLNAAISFDKNDVYKTDVGGNFKVVLSPPVSVAAGTVLSFTAGNNAISSNTLCGLVVTGGMASPCTNTSGTITCPTVVGGTTFTVCCYNVIVTDPIALTAVTAVVNSDNTLSGLSTYLTSTVYSAASQIGTTPNPFSFVTNNSALVDVIGTKSASITNIAYSQVNQESGIGKVTFTVTLPREPTRDMKLSIQGDLSGMLVQGTNPRCSVSFGSTLVFGSNWDNGDALIDSCSTYNFSSATPVVITTKKIIYKCGISFSKTIYVSLWPIVVVNWNSASANKSFKVSMNLNSSDAIALNTSAFNMALVLATTAKPNFVGQWDTLCAVSSVYPKLPGEIADYTFSFDLDTNKSSLQNTNPNEVTIFFPYQYFGSYIPNVLCYYNGLLNCSFTDEGILNIRFTTNIPVGSGNKVSIVVTGIVNPAIDADFSFPCTVNTTNFSTGARTNLITGSGKLAGGINTASVTANGALRFLSIPTAISSKNPRDVSVHQFRISFDYANGMTASPITIANTPVIHINFPSDYKLAWYTSKPSATIDEYTSDANNAITKTSSISPASVVQSGNRISITLSQASYTFGTNWRYWDITITNIVNPTDTTVQSSAPISQTTRPFSMTLTNGNLTSLFKTYTNLDTYASVALTTAVDSNLAWNRGNSFIFDNTKWVIDIFANNSQLNMLTIKSGRYLQAYFSVKANPSIAIIPWVTTISLTDTVFSTMNASYQVSTSIVQPIGFYIGAPCGTAPGSYLINFQSSDATNFAPLSPVVVTVDTSSKGIIAFATPSSIPAGGSTLVSITLSDPNFDALNVNWAAAANSNNDATATITNVVIAPKTITSASNFSIYSVFSITNTSTTVAPQSFSSTDPNSCFSWNNINTITFNISGQTAIIPSLNLAQNFKYTNSDNDTTLTAKNSIKFNFTPPAAPIYIYCALTCASQAFPADSVIQTAGAPATNFLQFYTNIASNLTPIDIVFSNLVRGQQYHLRCIIQSTNGDATKRSTSSVNIENYTPAGTANVTTVNIIPSVSQSTQCAQWQLLSDPGQSTRNAIVNYCQKLYSSAGWMNNGCIICTFPDLSYVAAGLSLPTNTTCPVATTTSRLRFLQSTTGSTINAATNTTASTPSSVTVCPVAHPVCATDVSGNKSYQDYFNQLMTDLKTTALFKQTLNIDNVNLNANNPILTVKDIVVPDMTLLSSNVTSFDATGALSFTANFPTPVNCYWMLSSSTTVPSFATVQQCTDAAWCGSTVLSPMTTTVSTTTLKAFSQGSTYQIYMGCTNNVPFAQKLSNVVAAGTFSIPAPVIPINNNVTNSTTAASFSQLSWMAICFVLAFLF